MFSVFYHTAIVTMSKSNCGSYGRNVLVQLHLILNDLLVLNINMKTDLNYFNKAPVETETPWRIFQTGIFNIQY